MTEKQQYRYLRDIVTHEYERIVDTSPMMKRTTDIALYPGNEYGDGFSAWFNSTTDDTKTNVSKNLKLNTDYVATCFDIRAMTCATAPWKLYREDGRSDSTLIERHTSYDLFRRVNEEFTNIDLEYLTQYGYDIVGELFWYIELNGMGVPVEITPLFPGMGTMKIRRDNYGAVYDYEYTSYGKVFHLHPDNIYHERRLTINDPTHGLGVLNSILKLAQIDSLQKLHGVTVFDNQAAVKGQFVTDQHVNDKEFTAWKARIYQTYQGMANRGIPFVGSDGFKWEAVGMNQQELDYINSLEAVADQIISMLIGSRVMLGQKVSTYAEALISEQAFLRHKITPILTMRAQRRTQNFFQKYYDEKIVMRYDNIVPQDREVQLRIDQGEFSMGLLTVDEMAIKRGLPPVGGEEGKKRYIATNLKDMAIATSQNDTGANGQPKKNP